MHQIISGLKDEKEFNRLAKIHPFYFYLEIREKTESGLVFKCTKLNKETGLCSDYKNRSMICRVYPQEEIFMLGGYISEECGYKFVPLEMFEDVLTRVKKKGISSNSAMYIVEPDAKN